MTRMLESALILCVVCGCRQQPGGTAAPSGQASVTALSDVTAVDIRQRFRELRRTSGIRPVEGEQVVVRKDTFQNCLARINDSLRPAERGKYILAGSVAGLDRDGDCWVAELQQDLAGGQIAYFDDRGELVMTWLPPEG